VVLAPFDHFLKDGFVDLLVGRLVRGVTFLQWEEVCCVLWFGGSSRVLVEKVAWFRGGERRTYVGNRHFSAGSLTKIIHHIDDEHRALCDLAL
jgi:hypothetical protein